MLRTTRRGVGGRLPPATLWTLLVSVGLLVAYAFADGPAWVDRHVALSGEALRRGEVWTLVTALLVHLDARDLLANGIGLWAFGAPLEREWGARAFLRFLLGVGVLANVGAGVVAALGAPGRLGGLGAATLGLVVAWALTFGHLRVNLFGSILVARHLAYFVLGIAMVGSLMSGSGLDTVHLALGVGAAWWFERRPPTGEWVGRLLLWRRRRRLRVVPGGARSDRERWN